MYLAFAEKYDDPVMVVHGPPAADVTQWNVNALAPQRAFQRQWEANPSGGGPVAGGAGASAGAGGRGYYNRDGGGGRSGAGGRFHRGGRGRGGGDDDGRGFIQGIYGPAGGGGQQNSRFVGGMKRARDSY